MGDFNYRIDATREQVLEAISTPAGMQNLVLCDQLTKEREARRVFEDYMEGPLNFAPSYKV
jgi:hypothetical protein